jgi:hypothetical protein
VAAEAEGTVKPLEVPGWPGVEVVVDHYMPPDMIAVVPKDPWHEFTTRERDRLRSAGDDPAAKFAAMVEVLGSRGRIAVARNIGTKLRFQAILRGYRPSGYRRGRRKHGYWRFPSRRRPRW